MEAIGVYGGTFDPVHLGHLRTAQEVRERLSLARVLMVPAREPPHRRAPIASPGQRLAMLRVALAGVDGLVAETCELRRSGPSYMVDTLTTLRRRYGDAPLVLVLGMDAFLGLPTWHQWRRLLGLAHLLVMVRPGTQPDYPTALLELLERHQVAAPTALLARPAGCIHRMRVSQLDISATAIRELIAAGRDPRFLLPDSVRAAIRAGGWYATGPGVAKGMALERIDHLVLTVSDIPATVAFYRDLLGMEAVTFGGGRTALHFGPHKINLHRVGDEFAPHARRPQPGAADLCLVTALEPMETVRRLRRAGVAVELGPVSRSGALGPVQSVYFRDPDGNLIELASYAAEHTLAPASLRPS